MVERATLHNENEVNRLGLYVGAQVLVTRAGDVIPKITGLVQNDASAGSSEIAPHGASAASSPLFRLPDQCPVCGSATDRLVTDGSSSSSSSEAKAVPAESVGVYCSGGVRCSAQAMERIRCRHVNCFFVCCSLFFRFLITLFKSFTISQ
jgi:DNA ligase (NAD+)